MFHRLVVIKLQLMLRNIITRFIQRYKGDFNPFTLFQLEYLRDHMATHSAEKRFECRVCHKKFQTMRVMKKHEKTHKVSMKYFLLLWILF